MKNPLDTLLEVISADVECTAALASSSRNLADIHRFLGQIEQCERILQWAYELAQQEAREAELSLWEALKAGSVAETSKELEKVRRQA